MSEAVVRNLPDLSPALRACRRCGLWAQATQAVPGEGPSSAPLMLVGEQPGNEEDLAGQPFVGPAGAMLDRALREAMIPRKEVYVTNAVKHFKWEPRGKRRLHKRPGSKEITACRWWLEQERTLVRPKLTLALGATAAHSLFERAITVSKVRGAIQHTADGSAVLVTVHPSFLLRTPDPKRKEAEYAAFVADLELARSYALS